MPPAGRRGQPVFAAAPSASIPAGGPGAGDAMKRCAVIDDYQRCALGMADWSVLAGEVEIEVFDTRIGGEDAVARALGGFEIVCAMRERTPFPRSQLEKLPKLELLLTSGMRNLAIDVGAARERVVVCGTPSLGYPTAELTWGLILAAARSLPLEDRAVRDGGWQRTVGTGLRGKTLGVVGLGRLGGQVAAIGKAFGMEVAAWSANLTEGRCAEAGVRRAAGKRALLAESDVVTIHLLLSARTRGLISAADLAAMKPTAWLVNTSRGPIVDEAAPIGALERRAITGRSPGPRWTCSTSSRCRPTTLSGASTTPSSARISATSRRRTTAGSTAARWRTSGPGSPARRSASSKRRRDRGAGAPPGARYDRAATRRGRREWRAA